MIKTDELHDNGHQYYKRRLVYLCEFWHEEATKKLPHLEVRVVLTLRI
jgi:hypothetical protein